jgi:hypothetical protein
MGRIPVQVQTGQKVWEISSQSIKSWTWWHMPVIPAMWEDHSPGQPRHKLKTPFEKQLKQKVLGGRAWVKW